MKKSIHPEYYKESKTTCLSCSTVYNIGSTTAAMSIEVCGTCHPFYTGKHRILDSTGRVEKFNKKYAKFLSTPATQEETETKEEQVDENQ